MSERFPTPREIEQWVPTGLNDFIACEQAKNTLAGHLVVKGEGSNILISGETGTGKTGLVEVFMRTLNCSRSTGPLNGPCGVCNDCHAFNFEHSDDGLFAHDRESVTIHGEDPRYFYHVNCVGFDAAALKNLRKEIEFNGKYRSIVYLDEIQHLVTEKMDAMLLKPIRELNAIWIATGVNADNVLNQMLIRRFASRCSTSLPSEMELALFLAGRCKEWGIEIDAPETVALLAHRSHQITAECINVIARAAGEVTADGRRVLTQKMVLEHPFITGFRN